MRFIHSYNNACNIHLFWEVLEIPRGIFFSNTPPSVLPGERFFIYLQGRAPTEEAFEVFARENGLNIVARTWEDVWRDYPLAEYVFMVNAIDPSQVELGQRRIPIADLRDFEVVVDGVARPPGVFAGGEVPEFELEVRHVRPMISSRILALKALIDQDNELEELEKNKIVKYLDAIEAITAQTEVDSDLLQVIKRHLERYVLPLVRKYGEKALFEKITEFLDLLQGLL